MPLPPFQTDLHPLAGHVQLHPAHSPRTLVSQQQPVMPVQFVVPFFHPPIFLSPSPLSATKKPEEPNSCLPDTPPAVAFCIIH